MTELFVQSLRNLGHTVILVEKILSLHLDEVGKISVAKFFRIFAVALNLGRQILAGKPRLCFYFITATPIAFCIDAFFLLLIRALGIDYVLYFHGRGISELGTNSGILLRLIVNKTLSRAFGGIVLGEALKADINRFIPDEQILVLHNAIPDIDVQKYSTKPNSSGCIRILFLSNLVATKGPMEFVRMAAKIVQVCKNVRFTLAGRVISEAFFKSIQEYIQNNHLANFFEIPGPLYGKEKEKSFRENDIFVFPTYYERECSPLVNIEAMQWGLPVISSPIGVIPEVVKNGVNGFIVDPKNLEELADKVLQLIKDNNLRKTMGESSRKLYENCHTISAYEAKLAQAVNFFNQSKTQHN
ncbi:MAG TPA: glycosyltransferase family 4 protein [Mesotoga sp.]|nr:glycosyltransferase family 4 protein [Mesotoga sp.]